MGSGSERVRTRAGLAAASLVSVFALAACPPPDAQYQHVADTAEVREDAGRVIELPDTFPPRRIPQGAPAGDKTGRAQPDESPVTAPLGGPPPAPPDMTPPPR